MEILVMTEGARELAPIGLRMPDELRLRVKMAAVKNRRSMNSELLILIEAGLEKLERRPAAEQPREVEHA